MTQDQYVKEWEAYTKELRRLAYNLTGESKNKLYTHIEAIEGLIKEASQFAI